MARPSQRPDGKARRQRATALRDLRRSLLIKAAKRIFNAVGLEGATMRAIAAEAGCSTGAIYPYFQGKEELYAAVLAESLSALKLEVTSALDDAALTERPQAGLRAFFDYYRRNPDDLALGLYLFGGIQPRGLNAKLNRALNKQLREIFDLVEVAFAEVGVLDPADRTAAGIAQATGVLILEQTGRLNLFQRNAETLFSNYLATT